MNGTSWTPLAVAVPLLLACGRSPPNVSDTTAAAFVDVTVVPMDSERLLPHQTVVVRERRIAEIGPASQVRAPRDARRIDGRGKYLMPGLADMTALPAFVAALVAALVFDWALRRGAFGGARVDD